MPGSSVGGMSTAADDLAGTARTLTMVHSTLAERHCRVRRSIALSLQATPAARSVETLFSPISAHRALRVVHPPCSPSELARSAYQTYRSAANRILGEPRDYPRGILGINKAGRSRMKSCSASAELEAYSLTRPN
jgi:hypothetical protein